MNSVHSPRFRDRDGLRLLGLSRIPRCSSCPRLAAIATAHARRHPIAEPIPRVPAGCHDVICTPLVDRLRLVSHPDTHLPAAVGR